MVPDDVVAADEALTSLDVGGALSMMSGPKWRADVGTCSEMGLDHD